MVLAKVDLGTAPITVSTFCPFLKIMQVGMERMPYSVATPGDSSVLSLTALILPSYSPANSSIKGAIMRQGPHQGAQKSTRTGTDDLRTSASNVLSLTAVAARATEQSAVRRRSIL